MSQPPSQRYQIERRIDAGGMAEVFLAKSAGLEGFEKKVAIKRVLPNLVENKKFVRMFLDEARLSLHLSHANIVSVVEVGRAGESYFIVMEYIDGTNLKTLLKKTAMPASLAVYVILSVCKALAYAHRITDSAGKSLDVVHRDVSPPNILLSWQGEVKLTDFGLARAASQIESTDPGVVKGKFAYLSPEAARGESIDQRADLFACGTVLWELITGERLFQGKTDLETVENVKAAVVPSLAESHGVPWELDAIIAKCMASNPDERYSAARQLGRDLARFLVSQGESVTEYDLAEWLAEHVFEAEKPEPEVKDEAQEREEKAVEAELKQFVTLDEGLEIAAAYDAPEPGAVSNEPDSGNLLEDPRSWTVFEDGDEERGFFAQLANSGPYRVPEYDAEGNLVETPPKRRTHSHSSSSSIPLRSGMAKPADGVQKGASALTSSPAVIAGLGALLVAILLGLVYLIAQG